MIGGDPSKGAKNERNERLYADWIGGMKQTALAAKYGLSTSRVHLIIQDMQRQTALADMLEEPW